MYWVESFLRTEHILLVIVVLAILGTVWCYDELCEWAVQETRWLSRQWILLATRPYRLSWVPEATAEFLQDDIHPASIGAVITGKDTRDGHSWDGMIISSFSFSQCYSLFIHIYCYTLILLLMKLINNV